MAGQVRRQPDAASGSIGVEEQEDGSDLSRVGSDHVMPGVDPLHADEGVGLDGERGGLLPDRLEGGPVRAVLDPGAEDVETRDRRPRGGPRRTPRIDLCSHPRSARVRRRTSRALRMIRCSAARRAVTTRLRRGDRAPSHRAAAVRPAAPRRSWPGRGSHRFCWPPRAPLAAPRECPTRVTSRRSIFETRATRSSTRVFQE